MNKLLLIISVMLISSFAQAEEEKPRIRVEPYKLYSAGTFDFYASKVSVDGVDLGYVEKGLEPVPFGKNYLVYISCNLSKADENYDGDCTDWKLFNLNTHKDTMLLSPGFNSITSMPSFYWPYVAYVETDLKSNTENADVYCTIFNYEKRKVTRRIKAFVPRDTFATDMPRMMSRPKIKKKGNILNVKFENYSGDKLNPLCSMSITNN